MTYACVYANDRSQIGTAMVSLKGAVVKPVAIVSRRPDSPSRPSPKRSSRRLGDQCNKSTKEQPLRYGRLTDYRSVRYERVGAILPEPWIGLLHGRIHRLRSLPNSEFGRSLGFSRSAAVRRRNSLFTKPSSSAIDG